MPVFEIILANVENKTNRNLPGKLLFPFEVNNSNYWAVFSWEFIIIVIVSLTNSLCDCANFGFIIQTWAPLDILNLRITSLPDIVRSAYKSKLSTQEVRKIEESALRQIIIYHQKILT